MIISVRQRGGHYCFIPGDCLSTKYPGIGSRHREAENFGDMHILCNQDFAIKLFCG